MPVVLDGLSGVAGIGESEESQKREAKVREVMRMRESARGPREVERARGDVVRGVGAACWSLSAIVG
jgi:hypothetical protein